MLGGCSLNGSKRPVSKKLKKGVSSPVVTTADTDVQRVSPERSGQPPGQGLESNLDQKWVWRRKSALTGVSFTVTHGLQLATSPATIVSSPHEWACNSKYTDLRCTK